MMKSADADGDGMINFYEYKKVYDSLPFARAKGLPLALTIT